MSAYTLDGFTAADLSDEPEDVFGRELHDGVIYRIPLHTPRHQRALMQLGMLLDAQCPPNANVIHQIGVHVDASNFYSPDVVMFRAAAEFHDNGFDASDILLAVEVAEPSSVTMDRITKPAMYAESGIPAYWRIDEDYTTHCFRLEAGAYTLVAKASRGERIDLDEPWPVSFAVDDLALPPGF